MSTPVTPATPDTLDTPDTSEPARPWSRSGWLRELLLVGLVYFAYEGSRLLVRGPERGPNADFTSHLWLGVPADFAYASLHYAVTPAVLIWLWRHHHDVYRQARTWLAFSTVLALIGFVIFPAAMPSLHLGWALWCGLMLMSDAHDRTVRTLGALCPVIIALVVMGTGNHYLLDALAGAGVVALGRVLTGPALRAWDRRFSDGCQRQVQHWRAP